VINTWWENEEILDLVNEFARVSVQQLATRFSTLLTPPYSKYIDLS